MVASHLSAKGIWESILTVRLATSRGDTYPHCVDPLSRFEELFKFEALEVEV
jgi:hypothetical protein